MTKLAPMMGSIAVSPEAKTAINPWASLLPAELTICWAGGNSLTVGGCCQIVEDPIGRIVVLSDPDSHFLCASDAVPPVGTAITLIQREVSGQPQLAIYFNSFLDSIHSNSLGRFGVSQTPILVTGTTNLIRLFDQALDPTKDDLFLVDDPKVPFPSSLVAAYNWFESPPLELVTGTELICPQPSTLTAGGAMWMNKTADEMPVTFDPSSGFVDGVSIQSWLYLSDPTATLLEENVVSIVGSLFKLQVMANRSSIKLEINGTVSNVVIPDDLAPGWVNLTITISNSNQTCCVWISNMLIGTVACGQFNGFGSQTTTIGGTNIPKDEFVYLAIQSIYFFNCVLNLSRIEQFFYSQPTLDDGCIGGIIYSDRDDPIEFISGLPIKAVSNYYQFTEQADWYVYPPPRSGRGGSTTGSVATLLHHNPTMKGDRHPRSHASSISSQSSIKFNWNGTELQPWLIQSMIVDDICKFYISTSDGLIEISGLTADPNDNCAIWMTKLVGTAAVGLFSAITMYPPASLKIQDFVTAILDNSQCVDMIRAWVGSEGGGGVDYEAYFKLMKVIWAGGKISWALWECFSDLNWWNASRMTLSLGITVSSFLAPPNPATAAWALLLAAQLVSTVTSIDALMKARPAGCPSERHSYKYVRRAATN